MQVRYALRTRGVHVQSACLTCRSHKEKSTRFESRKWNFSNSSKATCLKRLCGDANQLAISRNDSVVRDGTFAGVRLLFSWSRACFVARFTPFLRERHQRHDASSTPHLFGILQIKRKPYEEADSTRCKRVDYIARA